MWNCFLPFSCFLVTTVRRYAFLSVSLSLKTKAGQKREQFSFIEFMSFRSYFIQVMMASRGMETREMEMSSMLRLKLEFH